MFDHRLISKKKILSKNAAIMLSEIAFVNFAKATLIFLGDTSSNVFHTSHKYREKTNLLNTNPMFYKPNYVIIQVFRRVIHKVPRIKPGRVISNQNHLKDVVYKLKQVLNIHLTVFSVLYKRRLIKTNKRSRTSLRVLKTKQANQTKFTPKRPKGGKHSKRRQLSPYLLYSYTRKIIKTHYRKVTFLKLLRHKRVKAS